MNKKTIGVVGGGQLCLMIGESIKDKDLPYRLIAVDPTPNCPAYSFLDDQLVGDYKDEEQIRKLGNSSDIITFEIELANSKVLEELRKKGLPVHPSPDTLRTIQDKYTQADFLYNSSIPVPNFESVSGKEELEQVISGYGLPLMIKARKDSYDGRGNFVLRKDSEVDGVLSYFNGREIMAQEYIPFDVEISVITARGVNGEISIFPVGENVHGKDYNILEKTIVPARVNKEIIEKAKGIAKQTMESLNGAGVFGIEMLVAGSDVLINEIAPRVHNSGHYTIEACQTSQFEQHIRAISGESLGNTDLISGPAVMHNIIGLDGQTGNYQIMFDNSQIIGTAEVEKGVFVHNYGKHEVKPYRKMGHFTVISNKGEDQEDLIIRAEKIKEKITIDNGGK